jgi:glycosyltransferase involved in cell wall biosynthesis
MMAKHGMLRRMITDSWNPVGQRLTNASRRVRWKQLARFAGRFSEEIPVDVVIALQTLGLRYWYRQRRAKTRAELHEAFTDWGSRFARAIIPYLRVDHDVFFGFSSASLEALEFERANGRRCVLDQIDAARTGHAIVKEEESRFPRLCRGSSEIPSAYLDRVANEWQAASRIVVNSNWSRQALIDQGVSADKIVLVPLPYRSRVGPVGVKKTGATLKILWLGTLCLGKGLPYAIEAAKRLQGSQVEFTFAGPIELVAENLSLPDNATYVGQVPRSAVETLYKSHDVFLFPTLSDGFGITQIEAMAYGLPVIATRCCGEVVEHGKSGYLVEPRSPEAIVECINRILDERNLSQLSEGALARAECFSPEKIWPYYHRALL